MNRFSLFTFLVMIILSTGCSPRDESFQSVNSVSFPESQIVIQEKLVPKLLPDSFVVEAHQTVFSGKLTELRAMVNDLQRNPSDSTWQTVTKTWKDMLPLAESAKDSVSPVSSLQEWATLNLSLLKISEDAKFADELDRLVYSEPAPVLTMRFLKSFIYTHVDDQIFVNFLGDSELTHHHTTGGVMKLTQHTDYPEGDEMRLDVEGDDIRFMDVFIRIPSWAVNPTVTHGNVKYVAHPGEYCEISRKWKTGDEILVRLKN